MLNRRAGWPLDAFVNCQAIMSGESALWPVKFEGGSTTRVQRLNWMKASAIRL